MRIFVDATPEIIRPAFVKHAELRTGAPWVIEVE